jgi:hypothetical protein
LRRARATVSEQVDAFASVSVCPAVCARSKGFCSRFVRENLTKAKTKIQGFTPTDKLATAPLSSARGEVYEDNNASGSP